MIALAAADTFVKPHLAYGSLWPILVVFGAACVGVLIEAFLPRQWRYAAQFGTALGAIVVALVGTGIVADRLTVRGGGVARGYFGSQGTVALDGPTMFLWGVVLVFSLGGVLLFAERHVEGGVSAFAGQAAALPGTESERQSAGLDHTEVYPLLLFAVGGMMLFPAAGDLLTMFVALEVLSLPLYLLCGLARRRRLLSQEAAMKYFLLGAFSSGFFIYGVALIYGYAGSMDFGAINEAVINNAGNQTLLVIGMGMVTVGLLFKVGAAPFQAWMPDVYQGAPTAVTAFMAAATKAAAFGALLRLLYVAFGSARWTWQPMMWVIAILTMVVGTVLALVQSDMKRMLAYSSIAHTGFLLTGVLGLQGAGELHAGQITSLEAVMFYLVTYGLTTLGAFAVVGLVRDSAGEQSTISRWAGLGKHSPVVAGVFALFLLGMAGIPLTSGFTGKWAVFEVALAAGAWPVVVVAVLASAAAAFFYVRVIVVMYFHEPDADSAYVVHPSILAAAAIGVSAVATLALGVLPGPVLDLAHSAGQFIR
ncbi:MAG TPA: NADH-quinone oxidoreductase subunit NuoN [Nocardioides sp.]|nr:NADH-quinone oxidoreductase subunit NuoN [Nocardioides sp.]